MADDAKKPAGNRTLKILLAASLALNVGIAGVVGGAMLRDGPPGGGRDFGMGPLSDALSKDDRKALRKSFVDHHPDIRGDRREMRAEFDAVVVALRAEPFDPAALDQALAAVAGRNQALLDSGRLLVAERLKAMSPGDRAAFADRLEERISKGPKHDD
jgi:uncharacterized membrane protein